MLDKIITFKASKEYIDNNKDILPIPSILNIPQWYKNLEHKKDNKTVKGCMPFLDSLTAGYILKVPVDYYIEHNVDTLGVKNTGFHSSQKNKDLADEINLNYDKDGAFHQTRQIKDSPLLEKNKNLPIHKINNPWIIKTPPGYSTLFVSPFNNSDDRFSIISGIVDTDTFDVEVNFPFIVNGDKYPTLKTTIKRGTPYVQVIPFKRQKWKMKIDTLNKKDRKTNYFFLEKYLIDNYKKIFWNKKSWR
tara:strand:- start:2552 stop:3292 length:741 start_codon:yes stop_codon:yes gene_type:complete